MGNSLELIGCTVESTMGSKSSGYSFLIYMVLESSQLKDRLNLPIPIDHPSVVDNVAYRDGYHAMLWHHADCLVSLHQSQ